MAPDDAQMSRLEAKIDNLASVIDLRLRAIDEKIKDRDKSTAQTLTTLSEVLKELAHNVQSTYVRRDVYHGDHAATTGRLKGIEDRQTWVARTAVTGVILPFLVTIMAAIYLTGIR